MKVSLSILTVDYYNVENSLKDIISDLDFYIKKYNFRGKCNTKCNTKNKIHKGLKHFPSASSLCILLTFTL